MKGSAQSALNSQETVMIKMKENDWSRFDKSNITLK